MREPLQEVFYYKGSITKVFPGFYCYLLSMPVTSITFQWMRVESLTVGGAWVGVGGWCGSIRHVGLLVEDGSNYNYGKKKEPVSTIFSYTLQINKWISTLDHFYVVGEIACTGLEKPCVSRMQTINSESRNLSLTPFFHPVMSSLSSPSFL